MSRRNKFFLFLLFAFTLFLLIPSLDTSIRKTDEGIYTNVTHEILTRHEPFAPTYYNQPYYNKLPLRFWISYATNSVIGEHNFSYRIPEVLFALALILLIALYGKKFFNNYNTGLLAGVLFITSKCYLNIAKQYTTNNLALLLNVMVMGLLWSWYKKFKENSDTKYPTILLISILSGLTFFTRTVYAFIPATIFFCFLLFKLELWQFVKREKTRIFFSIVIFLATIVLLFLPLLSHYDLKNLYTAIFVNEVYERATTGYHNINNYFYYFKKLISRHYAVTPILLISSLLFTGYKAINKKDNHLFLFLWGIIPVVIFSLAKSHLAWYILICFPALALIAANFIVSIISNISASKYLSVKILLSALALYCCFLCYLQISHSVSRTYFEKKKTIDIFASSVLNYKESFTNSKPLAIEANTKEQFSISKSDRYYLTLIEDKSVSLTSSEIISAIENNSYDFYMTSYELFDEINKRFQPKGIIVLDYVRKTFLPKTIIFSFNHGSEFAPLLDNFHHELEFSLQDDKSYKIQKLSKKQNKTYLNMTFKNFCVNEQYYFVNIIRPPQKLRIRYFYGPKAFIATVVEKMEDQEEIIIKPEKSCLRLVKASEGINIQNNFIK